MDKMDKEGKDNLRRRQLLVLSTTSLLGLSGKKIDLRKKQGRSWDRHRLEKGRQPIRGSTVLPNMED
jgi:hypothetical protein